MAALFSELKNLVSLVLEETSVTDEGVLLYAASKPQNLQHLVLSKTSVSHGILRELSRMSPLIYF